MVHGATTALEDTEYLFFCDGPVLFFDKDGFTGYRGWEQVLRMQQTAVPQAARMIVGRFGLALRSLVCSTVRAGRRIAFCQVVTQTRNAPDTRLSVEGKSGTSLDESSALPGSARRRRRLPAPRRPSP